MSTPQRIRRHFKEDYSTTERSSTPSKLLDKETLKQKIIDKQAPALKAKRDQEIKDAQLSDPNFIHKVNLAHADQQVRNTSFTDDQTLDFWLNALQPSQQVGAIIDGIQGGSYGDYVQSLKEGNSGFFSDEFYKQHPELATIGNLIGDVATLYGGPKVYKWGNTPRLVGEGAQKKVYSAPFWRKVYSVGGDLEYIQLQSSMPGANKSKFVGYTLDGQAIHSQPKVKMIDRPSKGYIEKLIKNHFFPTEVAGDTETVFINPATQTVMLDPNYGRTLFGRVVNVDPEVLSIPEYFSMLKKGGKLKNNRYGRT